jgi:hypothetical protein
VAFARRFGESDLLLEAYHCRWSTAIFRGDVKETIENGRIGAPRLTTSIGTAIAGTLLAATTRAFARVACAHWRIR